MEFDRKLILEDGTEYYGYGFGADVQKVCEIVFNTSMVGYQEIVSDPSYTDQAVVFSYPLIGNYGITGEDFESRLFGHSASLSGTSTTILQISDGPRPCLNLWRKTVFPA